MCKYVYMFFVFNQKTAYEVRISDWSSDVCSSDLQIHRRRLPLCNACIHNVGDATVGLREDQLHQLAAVQCRRMLPHMAGGAPEQLANRLDLLQIGSASWRERVCPYV